MYRLAWISTLFLQVILPAFPQSPSGGANPTLLLKSNSQAVQLDVLVTDSSGLPVHGLQKNDFFLTDNGRPRDIRIFAGEIEGNPLATSADTIEPPSGVYSNRRGIRDAVIATAIVIDAVLRPEGLQPNAGVLANAQPQVWFNEVRSQARRAIQVIQPGQAIAIYAACPELRVVQDFTFDPDQLMTSLNGFIPPPLPKSGERNSRRRIENLVPPMLSSLREAAARLSGMPGRKNVVWISQAYGARLDLSAVSGATDETVDAFNAANIPLYAVDSRFSPTCQPTADHRGIPEPGRIGQEEPAPVTCSQSPDVSNQWMRYLADATGGRAFGPGEVSGMGYVSGPEGQFRTGVEWLQVGDQGGVSDAIRFATDDARYAYEIGFYIPEAEMDGRVHTLNVSVPSRPQFDLHYRSGYTASASATAPPLVVSGATSRQEPASPLRPDQVGVDAMIRIVPGAKSELQVTLALAPKTVTRTADSLVVLDTTFSQTDIFGKELSKVQSTVVVPAPDRLTETVPYTPTVKVSNWAALLHIRIHDQATNRVGTITIPIPRWLSVPPPH